MLKRTLALLCFALAAWAKTPRPVLDMPIPAPGGKQIQLKQYRGKVVLLTLITTTCAECIQTVEILNKLQKEFGPQGFQAVAVAVNVTAKDDAGPFAQRYKAAFPIGYLDKAGTLKIADVDGDQKPFVPIVMFIDRGGVIHFQYFGNDPVMKDEEKSFRAIVGGMLKQGQ